MALAVLDALPGTSVMVFDAQLCYRVVRGGALREQGIDPADLEGQAVADVVGPERFAIYDPMYRAALRGEYSTTRVAGVRGGQVFRVQVGPLRDRAGTIIGGVAIATDITTQTRAMHDREVAITRAESIAGFGTWELDLVTDEITWSEGMYRIYALDPSTWSPTSTTAFATIAPRDEAMVRAAVDRAVREHRPYVIEHGIVRGDGLERVVLATAEVIYAADGTPLRMVGADQDITAQKQAVQYARSLIEASLDPQVAIGPEGMISDVNEATVRVTGVGREQLVGSDFATYLTEPDKARAGYRQAFAEGAVTNYPLTIRRADGALTDVLCNASVYKDDAGTVLGVFAAARDVTALRHAELEASRRAAELDAANRELARSNADLEHFAYLASHDLSEPLRAITGPIRYVTEHYPNRPLDDKATELLGYAVDGAARMREMIDALLAYSRVGRVEGPPTEVDTGRVVTEALDALHALTVQAQAQIVTDTPLPVVRGEPGQIALVFQNLIGNAIKFARPDTRPLVHIAAEPVDQMWRFTVTDNGIGIPERHRTNVFTMFKRLHTQDDYPGTGMGLAIVKKIVERHDGQIAIDDNPTGPGTEVWFTLPAGQVGNP